MAKNNTNTLESDLISRIYYDNDYFSPLMVEKEGHEFLPYQERIAEYTPEDYDPCGICDGGGSGGESVTSIGPMNFDPTTGKLTLQFVKNGAIESVETTIPTAAVGVEDITNAYLDQDNQLHIKYMKGGVETEITPAADLESLNDDIPIEHKIQ